MPKEIQSESFGENILPPAQLDPKQVELCERLDSFYASYQLTFKPSDAFRGAVFASRRECRSNPDWLAQATHSLREILYPLYGGGYKIDDKKSALQKFNAVNPGDAIQKMSTLWNSLNEPAHHRSSPEWENLLENFQSNMLNALIRQINVHKDIDTILAQGAPLSI